MKSFPYSEALKQLPDQFFARLVGRAQALARQGHDVIHLGQGNPDKPTPSHIVEAVQQAAGNALYHKYSPFRGFDFLKEAIATFYRKQYQVELDPHTEVAILAGGKVGLVEISQCLLNAGDTVLVPDPGYPDYMSGIAMADAVPHKMPLKEENAFLPDYDAVPEDVKRAAKLMFLNYPNNPTAGVATPEFFESTVALAERHSVCVVHDFAYGAIGFDGATPVSFLQTPGAKDVGIEIYTLSKTYNMAGWRIAFALGNPSVIESLNLIQDHYYCSVFGGIQAAAAEALTGPQECVAELVRMYEARRDCFVEGLRRIGWQAEAPKGSFFVWMKVPDGWTSQSLADRLLEEAHVVIAPGSGFGEGGEGYVRAGLLADEDRLLEAVGRIEKLELFNVHNRS